MTRGVTTCEHGYRYENALCPHSSCDASPAAVAQIEADVIEPRDAEEAVEQAITELHADLSTEAGGSPWHPIALELIEQTRADIAAIIEQARRESADYAPLGGAAQFADRIEDVWLAAHPGLARFYKVTAPDAARRAEYRAYLCSMSDHGCECLALDFAQWALVTR